MITAKQLNEILGFKTPADGVLSCYLELEAGDTTTSLLRRVERLRDRAPKSTALREDLDRLQAFVVEELDPRGARAVAVFSSKKFGLWRACYLPQPVKTDMIVGAQPAVKPLGAVLDQYHRFGVALVGPNGARFFEVFLGRGREYAEHALAIGRDHAAFAQAVADKLQGLTRNQGFQRVVVSVSEELSSVVLGRLNTQVQQNLIVDTVLGPDAPVEDVVARIGECEAEARKVRETVLAHRLVDASKTTRGAVLGLERTLEALQRGRVKLLLVRDGFAKMGRSCTACGELSLSWSKCPACNAPTEAVFNLVGEMAARAIERGCEVVRLFSDTPLDNVGRIGAELAPSATISAAGVPAAAGTSAA